jgi:hypothetical protein
MGISILELVLMRLREERFHADVAYPGQKFPPITDTVAAVHIEEVDRANLTVTVEVSILSPAALGGTACEMEALRATEALRWSGAVCVQRGCTYDGVSQVYVVSILATFTCITEDDALVLGPGFRVYLNEVLQRYGIAFSAEEKLDRQAQYAMGETAPVGISMGGSIWEITLEELIPIGSPENLEPKGAFEVRVVTDVLTEEYYHCRWTSVRRELTSQGLRKIRKGIAMERQEVSYE